MKDKFYLGLIFIIIAIFFAPFLKNPTLLTQKDNDFGRNYMPIIFFIKDSFSQNKQIPLWRPDQFMGSTFIGNPVLSILYPLNILFVIFQEDLSLVIYLLFHFALAGISTSILGKSFGFKPTIAFVVSIFYVFSTKMLLHLEAGHLTMIASFAYIPLLFLSIRKILVKGEFLWILSGAVSMSFIYLTYATIFYYTMIFVGFYSLYYIFPLFHKNTSLKNFVLQKKWVSMILMILIFLGLSAVTLIPQLEFGTFSTRSRLQLTDVAIPLWNFKKFTSSLLFPYLELKNLDHESFLYLGFIPMILSFFGFLTLSKMQKIFLVIISILTLIFISGLSTPLFELAYKFLPFLKYSRVTTRLWVITALIVAILAGKGLAKIKNQKVILVLGAIYIMETLWIFRSRFTLTPNLPFEDQRIYQEISQDKGLFRVYCTTACLNLQLAAKYHIQNFNGESPIQDARFIDYLEKAGNYNYSHFAVIFPPYQIWQTQNPPNPSAELLGLANVKYVVSTYQIENPSLRLISKYDSSFLYHNNLARPRAYFQNSNEVINFSKYSPNQIDLNFPPHEDFKTIILSELYYPGWYAKINNQKFPIEFESIFRKITVPPQTEKVTLIYQPKSLSVGKIITLATISALILYHLKHASRKND